jgi:hypothetical protein
MPKKSKYAKALLDMRELSSAFGKEEWKKKGPNFTWPTCKLPYINELGETDQKVLASLNIDGRIYVTPGGLDPKEAGHLQKWLEELLDKSDKKQGGLKQAVQDFLSHIESCGADLSPTCEDEDSEGTLQTCSDEKENMEAVIRAAACGYLAPLLAALKKAVEDK